MVKPLRNGLVRYGLQLSHFRSGGTVRAQALVKKLIAQEALKRKASRATTT